MHLRIIISASRSLFHTEYKVWAYFTVEWLKIFLIVLFVSHKHHAAGCSVCRVPVLTCSELPSIGKQTTYLIHSSQFPIHCNHMQTHKIRVHIFVYAGFSNICSHCVLCGLKCLRLNFFTSSLLAKITSFKVYKGLLNSLHPFTSAIYRVAIV